ncbi:hypothetical protein [Estrella lausannensis]|uniref:Conserved putative secreted protein n=1 Tax=Estrella lausannensis TaxID=483423 RepID=A0A0H5DNP8_9BACT|nr:hypothetical protein [Estrella lausannensis]CRX37428.1 Conserved putative secreted protein [Estrella lausannensis]
MVTQDKTYNPYLILFALGAFLFLALVPLNNMNAEEAPALVPAVKEQGGLSQEMKIGAPAKVDGSSGELKGSQVPYCLKFDPAKWELTTEISNPAAEFAFKRKGEAIYAFIIPEQTPVPIDMMPEVIVYNATSKGMKDVKIVQKETRKVDGKDVLFVEWEGVIGDTNTKISYLGYIYSGNEGTIQFYTFTMGNFLDMYRNDMMAMLNGLCFVEAKPVAR